MGDKTLLERVIDLETQIKNINLWRDSISAKVPVYDRIIQKKQSYDTRLKKARAALKRIKEK